MAQTLLTPNQITREAMLILDNTLVLTRNADRQYDDYYARDGAKIGDTLRIRKPDRRVTTVGPALQAQETQQQKVDLIVSTQRHVDLAFQSTDLALSLDRFSELIIKPCISQLASDIDLDVANGIAKLIGNSVGTPGTTPATAAVILAAGQKMNELATPQSDRYIVTNPAAQAALVGGMQTLFNPAALVSDQFRTGLMGKNVLGFSEVSMSQNIPQFLTGTRTNGTVATTATNGATTLALAGLGAAGTVKAGDVFTVANVYAVNPQTRQTTGALMQFVVLADATADGAGAATVTVAAIYVAGQGTLNEQALATVNRFPTAADVVTWVGGANTSYPQNLALHKNALAFVTADLPLAKNMEMATRVTHKGISMRLHRGYDINLDRFVSRIDVLYGFQLVRPETAVRIWG